MPDNTTMLSRPVFLVGAERGGTTMLRLMLDHHPKITWLNEFEYSVVKIPEKEGQWPDLPAYYEWLDSHRIFRATGFTIDRSLDYPHLVDSFLRQRLERSGKPIIGATVHYDFHKLLRIWPDAVFIHNVRDPRDVGRSVIVQGWAGNLYTAVSQWIEAERHWDQMCKTLPEDRRVEVQFENVIADPQTHLTRICELIGVPYDPAMLSYPEGTTFDLPDPKLTLQWKRKLSEHEIQLAEARLGDMLEQRGFEPSGLAPLEVSPKMLQELLRQDTSYRRRFRIRRYGFVLWSIYAVLKRLPFKGLRRRVRLRLNDIDRSHLK